VRYEENGEAGFTSDLSTSGFDFFSSFLRSFFAFLTRLFLSFDFFPLRVIASSRLLGKRLQYQVPGCSSTDQGGGKRLIADMDYESFT